MNTPHLPIERLSDLVEGSPTPFDREHLATCAACTSELVAYRQVVAMAREERRRIAPPLTHWETLRAGLADEGLIEAPAVRSRRAARRAWARRAAAAVLMIGTGAVAGRVSTGMSVADAVALRSTPAASGTERPEIVPVGNTPPTFASADEALAQLQQAQRAYDEAATWLSAHDTTSSERSSDQYRTRLAALDLASETFEQALTDAPEDPILNQYFMATMSAREVAIRRLGTTMPASMRVGRF